jgi:hypothetical protein
VDLNVFESDNIISSCLSPTTFSKLSLCFEQTIFSRSQTLRINANDPQGDHDTKILFDTIVTNSKQELAKNFQQVFKTNNINSFLQRDFFPFSLTGTNKHDIIQNKETKAVRLLKKIVEKQGNVHATISQSSFTMISQQISDMYTIFCNQSTDNFVGDTVLVWLLTRGCILIEMNRIWEAVMMFKFIECLKVIII